NARGPGTERSEEQLLVISAGGWVELGFVGVDDTECCGRGTWSIALGTRGSVQIPTATAIRGEVDSQPIFSERSAGVVAGVIELCNARGIRERLVEGCTRRYEEVFDTTARACGREEQGELIPAGPRQMVGVDGVEVS